MTVDQSFSAHSRVGQRGAEVFPYVGLQHRVKVLKFSVGDEANYEHLSRSRDTLIRRENQKKKKKERELGGQCLTQHTVREGRCRWGMVSRRRVGGEQGKKLWQIKQNCICAEKPFSLDSPAAPQSGTPDNTISSCSPSKRKQLFGGRGRWWGGCDLG